MSGSSRVAWPWVLIGGMAIWALEIVGYRLTHSVTLIPAILIVGSLLVPVTCLVWALDSLRTTSDDHAISSMQVVAAFTGGGLVAIVFAAILEYELEQSGSRIFFLPGVAVVEEALKLATLLVVARSVKIYRPRGGMVLGAAVGFGFAAFETMGIAMSVVLETANTQIDLGPTLQTLVVRGLLAPFGHGVWTALVGGALFAAAALRGRITLARNVWFWFIVAVVLHLAWDLSHAMAVVLAAVTTGEPPTWAMFARGELPNPSATQAKLTSAYTALLLAINAVLGVLLLRRQWRAAGEVSRADGTPRAVGATTPTAPSSM